MTHRFLLFNALAWLAYGAALSLSYVPIFDGEALLGIWHQNLHSVVVSILASTALYAIYRITFARASHIRIASTCVAPLVAGLLAALCIQTMGMLFLGDEGASIKWKKLPANTVLNAVQLYLWTGVYAAVHYSQQARNRERAVLEMRSLAVEAQLEALHYQLNPHFLFNALNSIRALVLHNPQQARDVVTEIAEFLRYALQTSPTETIPLSQEIAVIGNYFAIEKLRFEDAIDLTIDSDPRAESVLVPPMLLIPLVENASKYGVPGPDGVLRIAIAISLESEIGREVLTVTVSNTGTLGPKDGEHQASATHGLGIDNLRKRLEHAFPGAGTFVIRQRGAGSDPNDAPTPSVHWVDAVVELDLTHAELATAGSEPHHAADNPLARSTRP